MIKQTIKFTDFFDNEREGTFYFNLNRTEALKIQADLVSGDPTSLGNRMRSLGGDANPRTVIDTIEELISLAYGVRSDDGQRFDKSPEISAAFRATAAYDQFFSDLCYDADIAGKFIRELLAPHVDIEDLMKNDAVPDEVKNIFGTDRGPVPASYGRPITSDHLPSRRDMR